MFAIFTHHVYEGVSALLSCRGTFWRIPCEDIQSFEAPLHRLKASLA